VGRGREDKSCLQLGLHAAHEVNDGGASRGVQIRRRSSASTTWGLLDEGASNRDSLLLASGELIGALPGLVLEPTARSIASVRSRRSEAGVPIRSNGYSMFSKADRIVT